MLTGAWQCVGIECGGQQTPHWAVNCEDVLKDTNSPRVTYIRKNFVWGQEQVRYQKHSLPAIEFLLQFEQSFWLQIKLNGE